MVKEVTKTIDIEIREKKMLDLRAQGYLHQNISHCYIVKVKDSAKGTLPASHLIFYFEYFMIR